MEIRRLWQWADRLKWVDFDRRNPCAFGLPTKDKPENSERWIFQQLLNFFTIFGGTLHLPGTVFTFCVTRHERPL